MLPGFSRTGQTRPDLKAHATVALDDFLEFEACGGCELPRTRGEDRRDEWSVQALAQEFTVVFTADETARTRCCHREAEVLHGAEAACG